MTKSELFDQFLNIKVHKSKGKISVHKPLLVIMALKALKEGKSFLSFEEIAPALNKLIKEIGNVPSTRANYPFVRLVHDKIWMLNKQQLVDDFPGDDPTGKFLIENSIEGGFTKAIQIHLSNNPESIEELHQSILGRFFDQEQRGKIDRLT